MKQVTSKKKYFNSNVITGLGIAIAVLALLIVAAFLTFDHLKPEASWMTGTPDSVTIREQYSTSPALSPEEAMATMQIAQGFELKLVAAEPLVVAPVVMDFDEAGRMWVVEMVGYMPDTVGTGEENATGSIIILEDTDDDGVADTRKVFMEGLILPRAISFVENGILVAEPPNLWFIEIENDKPGKKTLVDGEYAKGGNVEHQANGLMHAMDNWIYNAKSGKRYKKSGDEWLIDDTHFRGQWGITQDNYGRLFYNHNSANVLGEYFPPGLGATNKNQRQVSGFNEQIVKDKTVYPIRPTPGVNRAYRPGFLDPWLRLRMFTAACGPVIYRGGLFGDDFDRNAFVAEPSANLIKRNIIEGDGYPFAGRQAYSEKEFLASTDERFRPVSLYNGPDGALYIVDMYRGIIQHKAYLTDYLKGEIKRRALSSPLHLGRIYKVVPQKTKPKKVVIPDDPEKLVALLQHPNGWARDKAQRKLVEGRYTTAGPSLRKTLAATTNPVGQVHALWTLEGLRLLEASDMLPLLEHPLWAVRMNALAAIPSAMTRENFRQYLPALESMLRDDTLSVPLIAYNIPTLKKFDERAANELLQKIITEYPNNEYVADAVISNVEDAEAAFLARVKAVNPDSELVINKRLQAVLSDIEDARSKDKAPLLKKQFPEGFALYNSTCQACHGPDGNGVKTLAPPLNRSEWVNGNPERLASIVLFGLTGPVTVDGKLYDVSEISGDMPGIGGNEEVSDEQLAQLLSFIRASWRNSGGTVSAADIAKVRKQHEGREAAFTAEELIDLYRNGYRTNAGLNP